MRAVLLLIVGVLAASAFARVLTMQLDSNLHQQLRMSKDLAKRDVLVADLGGCPFTLYSGRITVGEPAQNLHLVVDTGSSSVAIAGVNCDSCNGFVANRYTPGDTAVAENTATSDTYFDGVSWNGTVYRDVFSFDGVPSVQLRFASISAENDLFRRDCNAALPSPYDGVIGFGYGAGAAPGTQAYADLLATDQNVDGDVFAVQLCQVNGRMWLGGFDSNAFQGDLVYVPQVLPTGSSNFLGYNVRVLNITLSNGALLFGAVADATLQTRHTQISMPQSAVDALIAQLNSSSAWPFASVPPAVFFARNECLPFDGQVDQLNNDLPKLQFAMRVTNNDSVTLSLDAVSSYMFQTHVDNQTHLCNGVSGLRNSENVFFGYAFMNQFVTVFDRHNSRIGFARTICPTGPEPTQEPTTQPPTGAGSAPVPVAGVAAAVAVAAAALTAHMGA